MFTFVTVVSVETRRTFAGVGVDPASTGRSVLTGKRQAVIRRCAQDADRVLQYFNRDWSTAESVSVFQEILLFPNSDEY